MRPPLHQTARLLRTLRRFFDERDFLEVLPRTLATQCVVDPYIDPLTTMVRGDGQTTQHYLQPSPEAEMKSMLAGGSGSIYSIGPAYRDDEIGDLHRVEFTMLEWYEIDVDVEGGIKTLSALSDQLTDQVVEVVSYEDVFVRSVGINPLEDPTERLIAELDDPAFAQTIIDDRDGLLDAVFSSRIQPDLVRPTIVRDYPVSQAALAKPNAHDDRTAARFEWFVGGVELGNGYDELLDAEELVRRTRIANRRRQRSGRTVLPAPTKLIEAMRRGLPPCAGVAVGVDRLAMVLSGAKKI